VPHITPRSLRQTWATFAAMIGCDPRWIAAQIGHNDPQFTFSVYPRNRDTTLHRRAGGLGCDEVRRRTRQGAPGRI
jgi:integrase